MNDLIYLEDGDKDATVAFVDHFCTGHYPPGYPINAQRESELNRAGDALVMALRMICDHHQINSDDLLDSLKDQVRYND